MVRGARPPLWITLSADMGFGKAAKIIGSGGLSLPSMYVRLYASVFLECKIGADTYLQDTW